MPRVHSPTWLVVALGIGLCACTSGRPDAITTTVLPADPIGAIEERVVLPERAEPLDAYDRYYATDRVGDLEVIRGVYLLRRAFGDVDRSGMTSVAGRPGVFQGAAEDLPIIADGGCAVISVYFDVVHRDFLLLQEGGTDRPLSPALCNGLA